MLSAHDQMQPVNTAIGEQKHYEKPKLWFLGKNEAALGATTPKDSLIHHIELMGEAWFSGCHSGQHAKKCAYPRLRCCRPEAAQWPEHGCMRFDTWTCVRSSPWTRARLLSSVLLAAQSPELTTCPMSKSITHSQLVWAILEAHSYINNYVKEIIIHWLAGSSCLSRLPSWK